MSRVPAPTDLLDLPFMRTAVLELCLLAVAGGLLGAGVGLRRLAFFPPAVGSSALPGLVVAGAGGVRPVVGGAGGGPPVRGGGHRAAGRVADAVTGVALAAALATGVV